MSEFHLKLAAAIDAATAAHRGQFRDGDHPLPYITHPLEVASLVRYVGGVADVDVLCAAVLHDTVEEGAMELTEIEQQFGPRVAGLVRELTRTEPTVKQASRLEKEELIALRSKLLLEDISRMSKEAKIIKLADRISNLRAAKATRKPRALKRYLAQTSTILDLIPKADHPELWEALAELRGKFSDF